MATVDKMIKSLGDQADLASGPCSRCGHNHSEHYYILQLHSSRKKEQYGALPEKLRRCFEIEQEERRQNNQLGLGTGFIKDTTYEPPEHIKALEEALKAPRFNLPLSTRDCD